MKLVILFLSFITFSAWSQEVPALLKKFDSKIYSLKSKGVAEFVVDIHSPKLTQAMNDLMTFGKVKELYFRVYWTANPERMAIEVNGLPEGFKEVKDELKTNVINLLDGLLPPTTAQRFAGYKLQNGSSPNEILAQDTTGIAVVPTYIFSFDKEEKLVQIVGKKPVGTIDIVPTYSRTSFSEGKWVLDKLITTATEAGQTIKITKEFSFGKHDGHGVLKEMTLRTEQSNTQVKPLISEEKVVFKTYKINSGEALKYFLGESNKLTP